jgi:molybdopterin molybdotransferase
VISLEDARERILAHLEPLPAEELPLVLALGRTPTTQLPSQVDLPAFDNSSVDGFAVRAAEVADAAPDRPVTLRVAGRAAAGSPPSSAPPPGACLRIFTGAPLPAGIDAVVMQEDTLPDLPDGSTIRVTAAARPWENVRFTGEDLRRGQPVAGPGEVLRPSRLALLAAAGYERIPVSRRPRVILCSTGNELGDPGRPLRPGEIHDSNRVLMEALAAADGAEVLRSERVPDSLEASVAAFRRAVVPAASETPCDLLITTGGVSVGDADHLKPAWAKLGGTLELWRVAMKPGRPFAWGRFGGVHWFGLPGNPVSAFVSWTQFVRPALRRLLGAAETGLPRIPGRLAEPVANRSATRHFLRVKVEADGSVRPAGIQASHIQSALAAANGLLEVPPQTDWPAGRTVVVEWLG